MTKAPLLSLRGLGIRFGGLVAVDEVNLDLPHGHITCIIGPNGAGKSTLFNLITGIYKPTSGQVVLNGETITALAPHKIAAKGIARTFQSSRLFEDLSILDNVIIGMHARTKTGVLTALLLPWISRRELEACATEAGDILNRISPELYARRYEPAGILPQADRRRLEIARALASHPKLILLDEPSSGMDDRDTAGLMADIRRVMADTPGLSFLIIEHDMRLVAELPDDVIVIDYGKKIAEGDFAEVRLLPRVQQAYLGQKAVENA
ncbi:ABC transporter ATP-binding protein [Xinfangfangia sp. D13-10-4-6]|uniref:ABC transporter ATP-binding protein n=1 Tax=Pseudogemmobacter hezensis TaxID=2737662 RepID=UPI00155398D8|nr:ABC transporter ATP-binding protein [Pseudogemmobacter hezensis]NPD16731.1 ABC transporter ATP-binding protein [Pseudogemmobacter hezensis]